MNKKYSPEGAGSWEVEWEEGSGQNIGKCPDNVWAGLVAVVRVVTNYPST